ALVSIPIGIMLAFFVATLVRTPGTLAPLNVITSSNVLFIWMASAIVACLISTALWILLAAIAGIMLLHRVVWPLISRLLYALGRYRLVQNKVALNAAGATLTGIAITGSYGWHAILKYFGVP